MLDIQIKTKEGIILKTANKFISDDITVSIDTALIGTDTTDATANAEDLVGGKTAYVNNEKITGSIDIEDWSETYILDAVSGIYPAGMKEVTTIEVTNVADYATAQVNDPNLKSENILKDVSILGITGTCIPFEEPSLQEKTASQNGEILPDPGYDGLSKVTVDSGYEDRLKKIFDSSKTCRNMFSWTDVTDESLGECLSYTDTSNVTDMSHMFNTCRNLTTIPQLDTSKVTSMEYMFFQCRNLVSIPQLNTSNVIKMNGMFNSCPSLTSIPQLNTSNATKMGYMFSSCSSLTEIPQLDTSNVTDMYRMFTGCSNLTTIPQLDTSKVASMEYMFGDCRKIEHIDLTYYNISSTSNSNSLFAYCHSLKELIIRSFGANYTINTNAFTDCYHLTGTVNSTFNPNGLKDCYIYVPRSMVDTLKAASGWSDHASQIRALEDYTVDGTTQGDLDPNKIN